ncbi:MAG: NADH-quinone oxidoreductase subunit C [Dehalococcoidia bacterium]
MTSAWSGEDLAAEIGELAPDAVVSHRGDDVWVRPDGLLDVMAGLRERPSTAFEMLVAVTGVDYIDHFEVVYHLLSLTHNRSGVIKVRCGEGRTDPAVPSVTGVWQGADFQERETYDLMGIRFDGHPNLKRLFLWDTFEGHPQRKDYIA